LNSSQRSRKENEVAGNRIVIKGTPSKAEMTVFKKMEVKEVKNVASSG
jgi:hypothetical protein